MSLKMFHVLVSSLLFTGKHLAPCLMSFPSGVLNSQLAKKKTKHGTTGTAWIEEN